MAAHDFRKIEFGFSSAEAESSADPGLLLDGFVEIQNAFEEARNGRKFLFLGYKGAGKSAIGERLRLSANAINEFVKKIGNIMHRPGGKTFYTFNYRNRHSKFNQAEGIMLHRGLWKALNLI